MKRGEEAEAKLSVQVSALNENMATLKREWQSSQRRVGELEKQTDELRGEIAVLEATVQNNQDERRALLERCVGGASIVSLSVAAEFRDLHPEPPRYPSDVCCGSDVFTLRSVRT